MIEIRTWKNFSLFQVVLPEKVIQSEIQFEIWFIIL